MCGGISGTLGALSGIVEVAEERWRRPLSPWGLPSPLEVVRAPQSFGGACQVFAEMLPEIVRTTEGLGGGGPEVCGVSPLQPCGRPGPAPPQGRPQREAGRAKAAGRGGPQGWAAGLRGPPGRAALLPSAHHGAAAPPGLHPGAAAGGLPGGGGGRGRGVPAGVPGPARAPLAPFAALLARLLRQPVPNFPQAPSASSKLPGFRPPGVGRVSAPRWVRVSMSVSGVRSCLCPASSFLFRHEAAIKIIPARQGCRGDI